MAIIPIKCPSCGAEIKLDETMTSGFCMYCGSRVFVQTESQTQRIEVAGPIIADINIEAMIKSAQGFLDLGKWDEALELYNKIITQDSTDYRGWWGAFLAKTHRLVNYNYSSLTYSMYDTSDAKCALSIAPANVKEKLEGEFIDYQRKAPKPCRLTIAKKRQFSGAVDTMTAKVSRGEHTQEFRIENGKSISISVPAGSMSIMLSRSFAKGQVLMLNITEDITINCQYDNFYGNIQTEVSKANKF